MSSKKILVCILSYNASNHIIEVFNRIPKDFAADIAMFDDSSKDNTCDLALEYAAQHPERNIKVIKNRINQGYGGNQKVAYTYAIINNYDVAIMLHGDAQYAPELLPDMAAPIINENYGAVLGSRMMSIKNAWKGPMPKYKLIGNVGLTTFQNIVLGARLAEYHTGYRAYSTEALKKIPFESNSDYFHFDTDILIQLIDNKIPIKEISIPTHYGTEICHVNSVRYGLLVLKSTLISRLAKLRLIRPSRYDYRPEQLQAAHDNFRKKQAWKEIGG